MNKKNKKTVLMGAWIAVLILLAGGLSYINKLSQQPPTQSQPPPPQTDIIKKAWPATMQHAAAPPYGKASVQYSLVEFGDFQCPQCGKMESEIFGFVSKNPDKVNLYFVHRPFPRMHKYALAAAEASQIAAAHGKFWQMYQVLYDHQSDLEPGFLPNYGKQVGIDTVSFNKDYTSHKYLAQINETAKFCDSLGIISTPTVVLHDNKTGDVVVAVGRPGIQKLLPTLSWAKPGSDVQAPVTPDPE